MIKSYLITAFRNLFKHKSFSAINIIGLSLSMTVCLLIINIILDQLSYDNFHPDKERLYRILTNDEMSDEIVTKFASTAFPLAQYMEENYPVVENSVTIYNGFNGDIKYQDKIIQCQGLYTDSDFFRIFGFELVSNDPAHVLDEPNTMVMREEVARKYFGDENPLGKTVSFDTLGEYTVTGIIRQKKEKSHIRYEALLSLSSMKEDMTDDWTNIYYSHGYLRLQEGADRDVLDEAFAEIRKDRYTDEPEKDFSFSLQAVMDIAPGPLLGNEIGFFMPRMVVYFMVVLALILILTAGFNYTNLSLAKSLTRAREIGVRKVSGAYRQQVFTQFITESVLASLIALVVSYGLLQLLMPAFTGMKFMALLEISPDENIRVYIWFFLFAIATGLLAGLIPAFYMSSFNPVIIFKDISSVKVLSRMFLRKVLVVAQFTVSIVLVITIILLYRQIRFYLNTDYGFNKENVVNIKLLGNDPALLKDEFQAIPEIKTITWSSHIPACGNMWSEEAWVENEEDKIDMAYFSVDENYMDVLGLQLVAGHNFPENAFTGKEKYLILNEKAVDAFHLGTPEEAIGQSLFIEDTIYAEIIGVIRDYHYFAMFAKIGPMALRFIPDKYNYANLLVSSPDMNKTIRKIEKSWGKIDPVHKLQYDFMDHAIRDYYQHFSDILYMVGVTSLLAILIACMGLFGMATYSAETRIKEIGVRKVLGANAWSVVYLISKAYLRLVLIAVAIALPLAWFGNNLWLQNFPYKVSFGAGTVLAGALLVLVLSLVTIGSQTYKVANTNPAGSLRYE
jgi:putative ABC transport system permease protein